jgi:pimeloyl-ACP methyl ester carboxylesterase
MTPSQDPPVLLVHGFASSAEHNWRQPGWLDLLADCGRETIAVDLPGHGTAPKPADPGDPAGYQGVEAHVAALIAFLRRPQRPLTETDLARITAQVLVVLGDKDPAGPGDGLVAALPDARLVTLRGADHFGTPGDVRCMQAVLDFLGC